LEKSETEWKRMRFRGNKVWLSIDRNEKPVVKNGKVLIKYQIGQDYEYWVHEKSIKPLEPSHSNEKPFEKKYTKGKAEKKPMVKIKGQSEPITETVNRDAVCIFTDGASSGNPGPAGIGAVLKFGEHEREISKYIGVVTNNIAELEAIRMALLELKTTELPVRLYTDSSYALGVLVLGWKARKNVDLVTSTQEIIKRFKDLKIIKIKGHAGHTENERADFLATQAIKNADR
jgi:ribonuclease HI